MNLYQKIQAVSNEIKNIEKNMTVGTGYSSYKAVSDYDVTLEVKAAETKHGVVSIPIKQELIKSEIVKSIKADKGAQREVINYVDIVKMTLRIIDLDNPSDYLDVESFGRGLDTGDKGFGKASTYARKYALLNLYKIATGEDPDKEKSEEHIAPFEPTNTVSDDICEKAREFLRGNANSCNKLLAYYNKSSIEELNRSELEAIYKQAKDKNYIK